MYNIAFSKAARKTLIKMPEGYRARLNAELQQLASDPAVYRGDWKPLAGSAYWRLRVGTYRAICDLRGGELVLLVLKIGSRGDVYK